MLKIIDIGKTLEGNIGYGDGQRGKDLPIETVDGRTISFLELMEELKILEGAKIKIEISE